MGTIDIQSYCCDDVLSNHKVKFNVNNQGPRPDDYVEQLKILYTRHWVGRFHRSYAVLEIQSEHLSWMKKAAGIGKYTGYFPQMYTEELQEACKRYEIEFQEQASKVKNEVFIRTETVSLKYGQHGIGPYNDIQSVIESLVTSTQGHECISESDERLCLYFLPWIKMHPDFEFRVFVYQGRITAISQQHIFDVNDSLTSMTVDDIKSKVVSPILLYFDTCIKQKMCEVTQSYVMDIALLDDGTVYFIEPNPFGAQYASGSALFHWINDNNILRSSDTVTFRGCPEQLVPVTMPSCIQYMNMVSQRAKFGLPVALVQLIYGLCDIDTRLAFRRYLDNPILSGCYYYKEFYLDAVLGQISERVVSPSQILVRERNLNKSNSIDLPPTKVVYDADYNIVVFYWESYRLTQSWLTRYTVQIRVERSESMHAESPGGNTVHLLAQGYQPVANYSCMDAREIEWVNVTSKAKMDDDDWSLDFRGASVEWS